MPSGHHEAGIKNPSGAKGHGDVEGSAGGPVSLLRGLSALGKPFRALAEFGRGHLILRFVVGVVLLMGAFYALYLPKWGKYDVIQKYFLSWNLTKHAQATGAVLRGQGYDISVSRPVGDRGPVVRSTPPRLFNMEVVRGCDALEPSAFFLAAVIAFPASWRAKLIGALLGVLFMELTNVVRLVTLFNVGVYWRRYFDIMHEQVWQTAFIVISVTYFALWALWATKPKEQAAHAAA